MSKATDINSLVKKCAKESSLQGKNSNKESIYSSIELYESSFNVFNKWAAGITVEQKNAIDTIVFHDKNNDAIASAAIVLHYLLDNQKTDIKIIPTTTAQNISPQVLKQLTSRNVILLDLAYS